MGARVLVADDLAPNRRVLEALLKASGYQVDLAEDGPSAIKCATMNPPDLALLDLRMPGGGIETLTELRRMYPGVPVMVVSAYADIGVAVEAMRSGAVDFLPRPVPNDALLMAVKRALAHAALEREVKDLRRRVNAPAAVRAIVGASAAIQEISQRVLQVARTPLTVLVVGETGAGKEVVARAIHLESGREGPFVAIDCGAIPENLLESELFGHEKGAFSGAERRRDGRLVLAAKGTVFLDEIGNLPKPMQAKLLRVLQDRCVTPLGGAHEQPLDVRFLAATNAALESAVAAGHFREDLYYRLSEFTIRLPPLRARPDDVLPLARRFIEEANLDLHRSVVEIDPAAQQLLMAQPWPGNVRELRNVVREAVLGAAGIRLEAVEVERALHARPNMLIPGGPVQSMMVEAPREEAPAAADGGDGGPASLKDIGAKAADTAERRAIVEALRVSGGNKSAAARALQVDFKTLHAKMRRFGLDGE